MNKKYFTPEEANQLLPYVREEISFLQGLKSQFQDAYREREHLKKSQSATDDDLFTLECKLEFMEMEAQMRLQHMAASGIQVKDIDVGLVDSPLCSTVKKSCSAGAKEKKLSSTITGFMTALSAEKSWTRRIAFYTSSSAIFSSRCRRSSGVARSYFFSR